MTELTSPDSDARLQALGAVAARLRCPNCAASLRLAGRTLRCARGHAFDVAREGYVTLTPPRPRPAAGDSAQMVRARERFLAGGHYAAIADALLAAADEASPAAADRQILAVDLGAGTGYYLTGLLAARANWRGVALDASRTALRRAVRAHPRIAAVACDAWQELPLADAVVDLVVNVFAPRNAHEIARMLAPAGALIVVTPAPEHLRGLIDALGLLDVGADKQNRLQAQLAPLLQPVRRRELQFTMQLDREQTRALVTMGPSAHHLDADELSAALRRLPDDLAVRASVVIETFRHSDEASASA
jgi:23S rRNA (guanine745-N1)-methyltransferase